MIHKKFMKSVTKFWIHIKPIRAYLVISMVLFTVSGGKRQSKQSQTQMHICPV